MPFADHYELACPRAGRVLAIQALRDMTSPAQALMPDDGAALRVSSAAAT
jgi:hypothetical protein